MKFCGEEKPGERGEFSKNNFVVVKGRGIFKKTNEFIYFKENFFRTEGDF